jgi:peptidylamidoglycolate lyase
MPTSRAAPRPSTASGLAALVAAVVVVNAAARAAESHVPDPTWPAAGSVCRPGRFQIPGVAIGATGDVLVLTRGDNHWMPGTPFRTRKLRESPVLAVSSDGAEARPGPGADLFVMPHQIAVDPRGHAWVVDVGRHLVVEFDAAGRQVREIGGPQVRFNMPTDVAFLADGSFVVSDGYGNARVVKFDADGRPVGSWGRRGAGRLEFQTPHGVAVDERDRIYVADRENDRVQVLTADGAFVAEWTEIGRPLSLRFAAGSLWVLSNLDAAAGIVRRMTPDGAEVESFHTRPADATGDFEWPHGLAVSDDGAEVYVGFTLTGRRVQRYRRAPAGP